MNNFSFFILSGHCTGCSDNGYSGLILRLRVITMDDGSRQFHG